MYTHLIFALHFAVCSFAMSFGVIQFDKQQRSRCPGNETHGLGGIGLGCVPGLIRMRWVVLYVLDYGPSFGDVRSRIGTL